MGQKGWTLLLGACGAACGPSAGAADGSGGDAEAEASTATAPGTASHDTATDATGPTDETASAATRWCGARDATTPIAVFEHGGSAQVLHGDGSLDALALPPVEPQDLLYFDVGGSHVAVQIVRAGDGGPYSAHTRIALHSDLGELVWVHEDSDAIVLGPMLDGDGIVVERRVASSNQPSMGVGVLHDAGGTTELAGFLPRRPRDVEGFMFGLRAEGGSVAWFDREAAALRDPSRPFRYQLAWRRTSAELVYASADDQGASLLVRERPGSVQAFPLPALDASPFAFPSPDGRWTLLVGPGGLATPAQWIRVDVLDGTALAVGLELSAGQTPVLVDCAGMGVGLDDAGNVLLAVSDDEAVHAMRFDPVAKTSESLGDPVADADGFSIESFAGTYLLTSHAPGTYGCAGPSAPSDVVLRGGTAQVLEPAAGYHAIVASTEGRFVSVSPDGNCAAIVDGAGAPTRLLDVHAATEHALDPGARPTWWPRDPP